MVQRNIGTLVLAFVISAVGCGQGDQAADSSDEKSASAQSPESLGVAIIDIDAVARRLGRDVGVQQSIEERKILLNQQFDELSQNFNNQIDQVERQYGENATPAQLEEVNGMRNKAIERLMQVKQQADDNLGQHQAEVINRFREQVRTFAQKVAKAKGFKVVLTNWESVFVYESEVDITNDVVLEMSVAGFKLEKAAASETTATQPTIQTAAQPNSSQLK